MADQALPALARIFDANGRPVPGALVTYYAAGTLTMINVYADPGATVLATNPVVADATGAVPQRWITEAARIEVKTAAGVTLYVMDPVPVAIAGAAGAGLVSFAPTVNLPFSTVQAAIEGADNAWRAAVAGLGDLAERDNITTAQVAAATLVTAAETITSNNNDTTLPTSAAVAGHVTERIEARFVLGTAQASTSGTERDFTGIPSWAKRVEILLAGVSTSGTSPLVLRVGTSSGFVSTGYDSAAGWGGSAGSFILDTTAFALTPTNGTAAANTYNGVITLSKVTGNTWAASGVLGGTAIFYASAGSVALAAALDRVRITTTGGADTFDAGTINITWQ